MPETRTVTVELTKDEMNALVVALSAFHAEHRVEAAVDALRKVSRAWNEAE